MQKSLTKKLGMTVAAIAMAATGLLTATDAEAVPAFARQTGMTCDSCHFQSYPVINGMGRSFKSSGYTMQGTQPAIESADLNLPNTLNMSVVWKYFFNNDTAGNTAWTPQDEVAFLVGGRVNASTGFLWEVTGDAFASQKIHFNIGDMFAVIPFNTDAAGVAYGFELMNTALERPIRPIEDRRSLNGGHRFAADKDNWIGQATGLAFVFHTPEFFVNVTKYAPIDAGAAGGSVDVFKTATFIRTSVFFDVAGFDTGIGLAARTGQFAGTDAIAAVTYEAEKVGGTYFDVQMQGEVGEMPLGIYLTNATGIDAAADTSTGFTAKFTPISHFEVFVAGQSGKTGGTAMGNTAIGFEYLTSLNTKILVTAKTSTTGTTTSNSMQYGFETSM